jgi:hypothetical protein
MEGRALAYLHSTKLHVFAEDIIIMLRIVNFFYRATSLNLCDRGRDGRREGSRLSRATTSVNSSQNLSHMVVLAKMKDSVRKCTKITYYLFINLKYKLG